MSDKTLSYLLWIVAAIAVTCFCWLAVTTNWLSPQEVNGRILFYGKDYTINRLEHKMDTNYYYWEVKKYNANISD